MTVNMYILVLGTTAICRVSFIYQKKLNTSATIYIVDNTAMHSKQPGSSQAATFVEFKSTLPRLQSEYLNVVQDCNLKNICSEVFFF